jgi:hypothetical protein
MAPMELSMIGNIIQPPLFMISNTLFPKKIAGGVRRKPDTLLFAHHCPLLNRGKKLTL